jgi:N-acyl-D-aspartate/D-glutamate deacylase
MIAPQPEEQPMDYDLILRGGTIADGTNAPLVEGDVAVRDGKIAAVGGKISGKGKEEVDAKGKLVTPGFVDVHTHYDGQATWEERLVPSSWHGVTTTVFGNCGVGFAPVKTGDHQALIDLMEGVEDIPGTALHEGLKWDWETFPDFLDALDRRKHDMDICAQLPHAPLRVYVMGERALKLEPANQADRAEMRRLTAEAVRAGALGVSTSRSFNHLSSKGDPTPTLRAEEIELTELAMGLKDAGRGVMQVIGNFFDGDRQQTLEMMRRIMRASGRPLSVTCSQRHNEPEGWREMLAGLDKAWEEGLPMRAQIAPRSIGSMQGLSLSRHPFWLSPSFQPLAKRPVAEKVAALRDPAMRAKLLSEKPAHKSARLMERAENWKYTFPLGDPPDYEPPKERSIAAMAEQQGRPPIEVAYDLMLEQDGHALLYSPNNNFARYTLDPTREMILHPHTCLGLSDGGAHVGYIADSGFPTFLLSFWGKDRKGDKIDVPYLVHWMTGRTAELVGLLDRGRIAPGMKGDLNVIDFDKLGLGYPYLSYDLPLGGMRFMQKGYGYVATYMNGVATYRDGEPTGVLAGKLVRGQQPAPV